MLAHPPLWQVLDDGVDRGSAWRAAVSDELPWRQGVGAFGRAATRSALAAVGQLLTGMLWLGGGAWILQATGVTTAASLPPSTLGRRRQ